MSALSSFGPRQKKAIRSPSGENAGSPSLPGKVVKGTTLVSGTATLPGDFFRPIHPEGPNVTQAMPSSNTMANVVQRLNLALAFESCPLRTSVAESAGVNF